jgi:glycosyltransferase involved in cell wall biosynthesis
MTHPADAIEISEKKALPESPKVSVCMLAYKHEKHIAQAIEGVVAQQCDFPVELVIGEDCSPDNTRDVALKYQQAHPGLVRIITSEHNVGMMTNFCRTMHACRGRFIALCEGDDYWNDPLKLRNQVELFSRHPRLSLAGHPVRELDQATGMLRGTVRPAFSSRMLSMHELILGDGGLIPSPSIMFRRDLLDQLPDWFHDAPVGDYPLVLAAGLHGDVAVQNRCMAVYRRNVPGSWSERQGRAFRRRWDSASLMAQFLARFDAGTGNRFARETRQLSSKLFSDALVRFEGDKTEKRESCRQVWNRLIPSDRIFCFLAIHTPWKITGLKTAIRKAKSLSRILLGELTRPRVR